MGTHDGRVLARVWQFGQCEFEEIRRKLWVRGQHVPMQAKPLDVLIRLLEAEGEPVTKEDLLAAAWESVNVSEESLTTAVRTLRRAIDKDERNAVIVNVSGVGYRIVVPVHCRVVTETVIPEFRLAAGDSVPDKPEWRLLRPLDPHEPHWVWLAEHVTTRLTLVFKFAEDGVRYAALQREITAARLLDRRARTPDSFIRMSEWRLTTKPYFLAEEYGGANLAEWLIEQRKRGLSRGQVLRVMVALCDAVEEAHALSLVHNDLKPSNILLTEALRHEAGWRLKVADFGVATLLDLRRLAESELTNYGFVESAVPPGGSAQYRAPEVAAGGPATPRSDVYALGVILFQLLCANFSQVPTPGWEEHIDDPLLRLDIADAVRLDASTRLASAAQLGQRLRTLEERRAQLAEEAARQHAINRDLERAKRQQAALPFVVATLLILMVALGVSLWAYRKVRRQQRVTTRINSFLTDDLLRQNDPAYGRGVSETLNQAIQDAAPEIDKDFANDPAIAASLHETIALSLDNAGEVGAGGREYDAAAAAWIKAEGEPSQSAVFDQMQHVVLLGRDFGPGRAASAARLLAQQQQVLARIKHPQSRVLFVADEAAAIVDVAKDDLKQAVVDFKRGLARITNAPDASDLPPTWKLTAQQRLCATELREGESAQAEPCFRQAARDMAVLEGSDSGPVLELETNIAQALLMQGKYRDAILEANAAYPKLVQRYGEAHDMPQMLLGIRSAAEGLSENWPDAIRDELLGHQIAARRDPNSFLAVGSLNDAGESECRSGAYAQGEAHAREAMQRASGPGQNPGLTGVTHEVVADCILLAALKSGTSAARLNEVERLLDGINVQATSVLTADPDWVSNMYLAEAQLAYLRKQPRLAIEKLRAAAKQFEQPNAEPFQRRQYASLKQVLSQGT